MIEEPVTEAKHPLLTISHSNDTVSIQASLDAVFPRPPPQLTPRPPRTTTSPGNSSVNSPPSTVSTPFTIT